MISLAKIWYILKNYFGEYQEVVFKGKRYHKHRWKDEVPLKEIK
jgi:hypothetical protein